MDIISQTINKTSSLTPPPAQQTPLPASTINNSTVKPKNIILNYILGTILSLGAMYFLYLMYCDLFRDFNNRCKHEFGGLSGWSCAPGVGSTNSIKIMAHNDLIYLYAIPVSVFLIGYSYLFFFSENSFKKIGITSITLLGITMCAFGCFLFIFPPEARLASEHTFGIGLIYALPCLFSGIPIIVLNIKRKTKIALIYAACSICITLIVLYYFAMITNLD